MQDNELGLWNPMEDRMQSQKAIDKGLGAGPQDPTQEDLWKEFNRPGLTFAASETHEEYVPEFPRGHGGNP